jgi:hypothetical protein
VSRQPTLALLFGFAGFTLAGDLDPDPILLQLQQRLQNQSALRHVCQQGLSQSHGYSPQS